MERVIKCNACYSRLRTSEPKGWVRGKPPEHHTASSTRKCWRRCPIVEKPYLRCLAGLHGLLSRGLPYLLPGKPTAYSTSRISSEKPAFVPVFNKAAQSRASSTPHGHGPLALLEDWEAPSCDICHGLVATSVSLFAGQGGNAAPHAPRGGSSEQTEVTGSVFYLYLPDARTPEELAMTRSGTGSQSLTRGAKRKCDADSGAHAQERPFQKGAHGAGPNAQGQR